MTKRYLTDEEFDDIVSEVIAQLPQEFRRELDERNVVISVKDAPDASDPPDFVRGRVLGFYHGVPLRKRGGTGQAIWPDKIIIYKSIVERYVSSAEEAKELLKRVVLHEIGHFFGLSDAELRRLGY
ncbi:metallopeptidase family protein [bacterium]|nr:metallopeptidase family protein [bacterium]